MRIGKILTIANDLLSFFADRLKVQLRDQGARHDLVDAVLALAGEGQDDLLLIVRRVEALGKFLATDDGKSLLAGYKRATNILRIEEKKDGKTYHGKPDPHLYLQPEERALAAAIHAAKEEAAKAVAKEDFERAMAAIAQAAAARRCVLRQGDGERRRRRPAREPAQAAERNPRGDAGGCGFFQDRGLRQVDATIHPQPRSAASRLSLRSVIMLLSGFGPRPVNARPGATS